MDYDLIQVSVLAFIQGFTEFLPISSSGHLLLPSLLLGWPDQGLTFDVAVHVGSLLAVITYFRQDLLRLFVAWVHSMRTRTVTTDSRLAWLLLLATVPGGAGGLLLGGYVENYARAIVVVASTSIGFAFLLYWADVRSTQRADVESLSWRGALIIGFAQVLALIPGTSRSGITMTAALFCNLTREAAARFSFLLSIPIILATGLFKGVELVTNGTGNGDWLLLAYAVGLSGIVAYTCIHYFLQFIARIGFIPFVLYRLLLGIFLLGVYFAG